MQTFFYRIVIVLYTYHQQYERIGTLIPTFDFKEYVLYFESNVKEIDS